MNRKMNLKNQQKRRKNNPGKINVKLFVNACYMYSVKSQVWLCMLNS